MESIYTFKSFCEGLLLVGFAVVEPGVWGTSFAFATVVFDVVVLGAPAAGTVLPEESVAPIRGKPAVELGGKVAVELGG
jgi:hypothetical protein